MNERFSGQNDLFAQQAGYHLYLVGGGVRDELMGRELHDFDLATDAPVSAIKGMLEQARPDSIYTLGEKFGTIGAIVGDRQSRSPPSAAQDEVTHAGAASRASTPTWRTATSRSTPWPAT